MWKTNLFLTHQDPYWNSLLKLCCSTNLCFSGATFWIKTSPIFGMTNLKFPQFFNHEFCNRMVVFSRIHLRISTLWAFLFQRYNGIYPSRRLFANNSIYKKATSLISFRAKRSRFSGCVCHIFYFLVHLERSFHGLKLGL